MIKGYSSLWTGLIGKKLSHSFSPEIHSLFGDHHYDLFEMEEEKVGEFLKNYPFDALNVTIPYKKTVMPFLDGISDEAKRIGAVNTVIRRQDGSLIGENTDYFGFSYLLSRYGVSVKGKKVLVFGSGGASATAVAVLRDSGAETVVVSRTGENNYENLDRHKDAAAIVNTTPVGLYPDNLRSPLSLSHFPSLSFVVDMIYNPKKTALLLAAEKKGIAYANGLLMLVAQAARAVTLFTGKEISDREIDAVSEKVSRNMRNIVLIGMPSSGKTTVGKSLAAMTGRRFVDSDEVFSERLGISPAEFIERNGESAFREEETRVLSDIAKESGCVIATGGGVVTRRENKDILRQNGVTVWLMRDIENLSDEGRPLSRGKDAIKRLYETRQPLYEDFADVRYEVDEGDFSMTARKIKEDLL